MGKTFNLNAELLEPVVQTLLEDKLAEVSDFTVKALKPGLGNPTSLGVYRVSGLTSQGQPFSLVVKQLADGRPFMDATSTSSWNYWKREIDFFESPIAARIPASIGFPKYLGQSALPDGTMLFWNGDLGDLTKSEWKWEHCLEAARLVAELNSIHLDTSEKYPWLCRNLLSSWIEYKAEYFTPVFPLVVEFAQSKPDTTEAFSVFGKYMTQHERLAGLVESARQTFVHGDFNLNNLVPTPDGKTTITALDWQLCGISGLAIELASIFNTAYELGVVDAKPELFEELCSVYANRFNELNPGAPTNLNEVRLNAAVMGFAILNSVSFFFVRESPDEPLEKTMQGVANLVDAYCNGPVMIYARVMDELLED